MKVLIKPCLAVIVLLASLIANLAYASDENKQVQAEHLGKVIWGDLYSSNTQASINFYQNVFGWTVKQFGKNNSRYHLFFDGEQAIAGVISRQAKRNKTEQALWIGSIASNNITQQVKRAANNKAKIIFEPHDFALYGQRAVIADPLGGVIALLNLEKNQRAQKALSDKWQWAQLFSVEPKEAANFYQASFDYQVDDVEEVSNSYYLTMQEQVHASVVKLPASFEQRDRWVNFIEVDNLAATLAEVSEQNGKVIYHPQGNKVAIIADPQGALLGLTELEAQ